jgi:hypothetical protein
MTALKDILIETNITFQKDGMRIINMDKSHTILVHLHLLSDNFEYYECNKEKIIVGVNMFHLFKLINTIDSNDTLTIYIENSDYVDGIVSHLALKFENGEIKIWLLSQSSLSSLRGIYNNQAKISIPPIQLLVQLFLESTLTKQYSPILLILYSTFSSVIEY